MEPDSAVEQDAAERLLVPFASSVTEKGEHLSNLPPPEQVLLSGRHFISSS